MADDAAVLRVLGDPSGEERAREKGSVLVIGNFDGVHKGHQAVLQGAVVEAKARNCLPAVLTFDPHPASVLGRTPPPMLTSLARRAELMASYGVPCVFVRQFDLAFSALSPETFVRNLLVDTLAAKVVVVGQNFRFGARRSGDLATLQSLGQAMGFVARAHEMACDEAGPFSSTRARTAVQSGVFDEVFAVLGRAHTLSGVVVHGEKRGRTIGFPTANLEEVPELLPPDGVYAVRAELIASATPAQVGPGPGARFEARSLGGGVMNIGVRPTVGGGLRRTHEVHLFFDGDFEGSKDLYGARLRVELFDRIRDEKRFSGIDELKSQIALDAAAARAVLARRA